MDEQQLQDLLSALNLYTSFFLFLIVLCFASFVAVLFSLIHNIKNRKNLQGNREFVSEIIQTQEAERNRISRELHDTVSQNIKTLLLKEKELSAILYDSDSKSDEIQFKIEKIIDLEKQNQKQLRTIIRNLAVPAVGNIPFKTVINDLCEQFKEQSGIDCSFFVSPDVVLDDFSKEQKHHILRIIQEALNNAKTHAKASETSIVIRKVSRNGNDRRSEPVPEQNLQTGEDSICIMIFDDGQGFAGAAQIESGLYSQNHFGMSGMEMRAKLLGGSLVVQSTAEAGTEVRLEIPVRNCGS
ncbi:sensor histidine kinase [Treponema sp. Marseille-Q4523]|uniref:sensor histidine kinase n=1 Tax=Treponema sp. Marseille-Q4523 TaxID=2810610 RepID=UPI001960324F|nr:sensor histidine kinase [Treponema sp. Marseille-Q4523]MBM7022687.1 sensor histidine kinase [Treponema sp. Marseille-Q4523]